MQKRSAAFNLFLLCLLCAGSMAYGASIPSRSIFEIRRKTLSGDSIEAVSLLYDVKWRVDITPRRGPVRHHEQFPAVIKLDKGDLVTMETRLHLTQKLTKEPLVIYFNGKGSAWLRANGRTLVATGYFSRGPDSLSEDRKEKYSDFYFGDTAVTLQLAYLPPFNRTSFVEDISVMTTGRRDENTKADLKIRLLAWFTGGFHLAFAAIFLIIFLYFRTGRENLYFALYACIIGIYFVLKDEEIPNVLDMLLFGSWVIALEFLAMFLSRVLLGREKNLAALALLTVAIVVMSGLTLIGSLSDSIVYTLSAVFIIALLILFEIITQLYYLIQGLSLKRAEARMITYGFLIGVAFVVALILTFILYGATYSTSFLKWSVYAPYMGLVTVLITMSIVLGRRNGENQSKLLAQLREIETLAEANLAKEIEKQQLLENQNTELERKVKERTSEVILQKEIIENKSRELFENLQYAQRIQRAILPGMEAVKRSFPESFVFYRPRDIVSGDFYTFIQKDDCILIAVADCTGHGVSGAFMSMIGSSLVNQLVNERNLKSPGMILTALGHEVIRSLRQRSGDTSDGMDIAMCAIDTASMTLRYAGANRPLWLVRNGVLDETKPDKFPIGGLQHGQTGNYREHIVSLQHGDALYLSTDGFADQFGGPKGKKLMTGKLKAFICGISGFAMAEQEQRLTGYFQDWKGAGDQVDDVLVLGLRIP